MASVTLLRDMVECERILDVSVNNAPLAGYFYTRAVNCRCSWSCLAFLQPSSRVSYVRAQKAVEQDSDE
jgi:hypothetical protein